MKPIISRLARGGQKGVCYAFLLCAAGGGIFSARAQGHPDVVWSTNSAYFETSYSRQDAISFAPDGTLVAWPTWQSRCVSRTTDGALVRVFPGEGSPAFSPDGSLLALAGTNGIDLWRVADGTLQQTIRTSTKGGPHLAFAASGALLTASQYRGAYPREIRLWRVADGNLLQTLDYGETISCMAIVSGGDLVSAGGILGVKLWRLSTGQLMHSLSAVGGLWGASALAFAPDSSLLASGTTGYEGFFPSMGYFPAKLRLWRVSDGRIMTTFTTYTKATNAPTTIHALAFSPDGFSLVTVSEEKTIRFWRVADGVLLRLYDQPESEEEPNDPLKAVAFSPDGRYYAYGRGTSKFVVARSPVWFSRASRANQHLKLDWAGGTGLYQLQQTSNVAGAVWQNVGGPTTNTSTNVPITATNTFFRLQSLPNAP